MSDSVTLEISWTPVLEAYFAETGEKAAGRAWLHAHSEALYSWRRTFIDLPVVIGSGVIGFISAGSTSMFEDPKWASIYLGIGSLVVATLNTVGSYFGWAKRCEGHRIAALSYAKLNRFLRVEMGLPRSERMRAGDLLKMVKQEIDRLAETSPAIPEAVKTEFRTRFKAVSVSVPDEVNGIHKVIVYDRDDLDAAPPTTPHVRRQTSDPHLTFRVPYSNDSVTGGNRETSGLDRPSNAAAT